MRSRWRERYNGYWRSRALFDVLRGTPLWEEVSS